MKYKLPTTLCSLLLTTTTMAMAATAPTTTPQHSGFHVGFSGAASLGSINSQAFYEYDGATQTLNETTTMPTGKIGASAGYGFNTSQNNLVELTFNYNHYLGLIKQTFGIARSLTPGGDSMSLNQKIRPQSQFNFEVNNRHFITNNFDMRVNTGLSILRLKNTLNISANGPSSTAASGSTQTKTLIGGLVGIGFDYYLTAHSALSTNINYFLYASAKLHNINDIDTGGTDSLTKRKVTFSSPELSIGYNYYF